MPDFVDRRLAGNGEKSSLRLAILATCSVPVLLLEDPANDGTYKLLGTCFIQGWMEGKILKQEMDYEDLHEFWETMVGSEPLKIV